MRIAIDLDNTIICYEAAFLTAAQALNIPVEDGQRSKSEIKTLAFKIGGNALWTKIQEIVYAQGVSKCPAFPYLKEFLTRAKSEKASLRIISHKSTSSYSGGLRLREPAEAWLSTQGISPCWPHEFCETVDEKVERINAFNPDFIVDDLPKIGRHPKLNPRAHFILFDPNNTYSNWTGPTRAQNWAQIENLCWP